MCKETHERDLLEQKIAIFTYVLRYDKSHSAYLLMSHANLGMQQQLLCQSCHGQFAFLNCVCFQEDKERTCC